MGRAGGPDLLSDGGTGARRKGPDMRDTQAVGTTGASWLDVRAELQHESKVTVQSQAGCQAWRLQERKGEVTTDQPKAAGDRGGAPTPVWLCSDRDSCAG